jgi:hypothetical protein
MVPIALEDSAGPERTAIDGGDPLGHAVRVALTIYLMPVIAIVCVLGGASILIGRASRLVSRFDPERVRVAKPPHLAITQPMHARESRRTRVSR